MILINFSHPITEEQRAQIVELTGQPIDRIIDVKTQFDQQEAFAEQVEQLVALVGLTATEWQTLQLVVNPPALSPIAVTLLAYLHGMCGKFPTVIRLRPNVDVIPSTFEVAEAIDLLIVRNHARSVATA